MGELHIRSKLDLSEVGRRIEGIGLPSLLLATFLLSAFAITASGYLFLFRSSVEALDYDEFEYWTLSSQLLAGTFDDVGRRTAGFPLLLAAIRAIWDNLAFVQVATGLVAATGAPLLGLLVDRLGGSKRAVLLAGVGLALWPTHVFFMTSLYSETLALPLLLLFLIALPAASRGDSRAVGWILAGLLLGLLAHVRTMYQLFLAVVPLIIWLETRDVGATVRSFALVVAGFALAVLPWSIYISRELGTPTLLTANGGETLAGGLNPKLLQIEHEERRAELRTYWVGPGKWISADQTGYLSEEELRLPYAQQNELLKARTVEWISSNPGDAAYLTIRKVAYMWGLYPILDNGLRQALLGNALVLLLASAFLFVLGTRPEIRRSTLRLHLIPLFVTGIALISWGSWRFRHPADAAMIATIALALASRWSLSMAGKAQASASNERPAATQGYSAPGS